MGAVDQLKQQGFRLSLNGDRIQVRPGSRLTPEWRQWIKANRPEIVQELKTASNQGADVQSVWYIQAQDRTFPMIRPEGMSRQQAEQAARARWPGATVLAHEPRAGGRDNPG